MTSKLQGKVALVTGAGRGIGRAAALKLGSEGAHLVLNDLDKGPLREVGEAVAGMGGKAILVDGSVTDEGFAERYVAAAEENFGGIDILVNNAGYTWDSVIQKMSEEQWSEILDVHLGAPFRLLKAAQPIFKHQAKRDREESTRRVRKVVNVSSVAGLFGNAGQVNYATAKAGIIGFTKTMAKEWGRYDVTVNCVAFGMIDTRIAGDVANGETVQIGEERIRVGINSDVRNRIEATIPLGRAGTVEEAAGAIYLFTIPESDYVSGETLLCSGGLTGI